MAARKNRAGIRELLHDITVRFVTQRSKSDAADFSTVNPARNTSPPCARQNRLASASSSEPELRPL